MSGRYRYLTEASPKTIKGELLRFLTAILYLSPSTSSGIANVCPFASQGCIATCLNTAGRAGIFRKGETDNIIQRARRRRTADFFSDRQAFISALHVDVDKLRARARRLNMRPAVRLNGTSDLRFDIFARSLFYAFPDVQFYDYTKDIRKALAFAAGELPPNYHVTFSWSETNGVDVARALSAGVSVAIPYRGNAAYLAAAVDAPEGVTVVDGDYHDLRFLDPAGCLVALTAKGKARRDATGFVVDAQPSTAE